MLELFGWLATVVVGVVLGLIGGGGSILTVPILVYLFGMKPAEATAYSLFVVGLTSLVGSVTFFRRGMVDLRTAAVFSVPAFLGVYLTRRYALPAIPETLGTLGGFEVTRDKGILLLFAVLMVATALTMIRDRRPDPAAAAGGATGAGDVPGGDARPLPVGKIAVEGLAVGGITGLVGAGGGFLVIPALVLLAGLPMKRAVGTSLVVIAAKSLLGFVGDVQVAPAAIDWGFLLGLSAVAVVGILIGGRLGARIPGERLKPAFGWFVLLMGGFMVTRELFFP